MHFNADFRLPRFGFRWASADSEFPDGFPSRAYDGSRLPSGSPKAVPTWPQRAEKTTGDDFWSSPGETTQANAPLVWASILETTHRARTHTHTCARAAIILITYTRRQPTVAADRHGIGGVIKTDVPGGLWPLVIHVPLGAFAGGTSPWELPSPEPPTPASGRGLDAPATPIPPPLNGPSQEEAWVSSAGGSELVFNKSRLLPPQVGIYHKCKRHTHLRIFACAVGSGVGVKCNDTGRIALV